MVILGGWVFLMSEEPLLGSGFMVDGLGLGVQGLVSWANSTVGPCLGTYGGPRGAGVSYERGTPAGFGVYG